MNLALNNLQRLICHKAQTSKQTNQILPFNTNNSIQHHTFFLLDKLFQVLLCITNNSISHLFTYC